MRHKLTIAIAIWGVGLTGGFAQEAHFDPSQYKPQKTRSTPQGLPKISQGWVRGFTQDFTQDFTLDFTLDFT